MLLTGGNPTIDVALRYSNAIPGKQCYDAIIQPLSDGACTDEVDKYVEIRFALAHRKRIGVMHPPLQLSLASHIAALSLASLYPVHDSFFSSGFKRTHEGSPTFRLPFSHPTFWLFKFILACITFF